MCLLSNIIIRYLIIKSNSWIIDEIYGVIKYRNKLAHSKALIRDSENYNGEDLPFVGSVNGEEKNLGIKMSDLNPKIESMQKVIKILIEFQKDLRQTKPNP